MLLGSIALLIAQEYRIPSLPDAFSAQQVQEGMKCLLGLTDKYQGQLSGDRRYETLRILGLSRVTVRTWRRSEKRHERNFLMILAKEITAKVMV